MRSIAITTIEGGIQRLRGKGGANQNSLYEALNCYITAAGTVAPRPGTASVVPALPSTCRGLCYFDGSFHVFSHQTETAPTGYVNHILSHPSIADQTIAKIHFAQPFMGFLYVVAEFANADIFHYWLASSGLWQANKIYMDGDVVVASADTGLLYRATRATPANPVWTPRVQRALGDKVEPTTYSGYFHTVVEVEGDTPRSGATEPIWPTEPGARVTESETETASALEPPAPIEAIPTPVKKRYRQGLF